MYGPPRRGGGHREGCPRRRAQGSGRFSSRPNPCISPQYCAQYHGHTAFYDKALRRMAEFGISSAQELQYRCSRGGRSEETYYLHRNLPKWVHAGFLPEAWAQAHGWDGTGGSFDQDGGGHGMGGGRHPGGPSGGHGGHGGHVGHEGHGGHGMSSGSRHGGREEHGMGGGRHPGGRVEHVVGCPRHPGRMRGGPGMSRGAGMSGGRHPGGMGGGRHYGGAAGRSDEEDMYYGSGSDDSYTDSEEDGYESY